MGLIRNVQAFRYKKKLRRRIKRMNRFVDKNIRLSPNTFYSNRELIHTELDYDTFICGSDQIWNTYCDNYDDAFILAFANGRGKRISYAASMGMNSIHEKFKTLFREELSSFNALSVREANAVNEIKQISGKEVFHVLDPVFLLSSSQWIRISVKEYAPKQPYIFFYAVKGEIKGMRQYVRCLSKYYNMPIVVVNINLRELLYKNIKRYDAGPKEFLSLIKNSCFVITNSFHGCAFSILFKKKFQIYGLESATQGTSSRIHSILNELNLFERVVNVAGDVAAMADEIDWNSVYELLNQRIDYSKRFLNDALLYD